MNLISLISIIILSFNSVTISLDETIPEPSYEVVEDPIYCTVDADVLSIDNLIETTDVYFEGDNCAEIFIDLLENENYIPIYSGTTDDGFYLSGIRGVDTSLIELDENIKEYLINNEIDFSESVYIEGELSEFDITEYSGWVYTVNGEMPSVGMCDYIPQPGDEIQLSFSLNYGDDIGLVN